MKNKSLIIVAVLFVIILAAAVIIYPSLAEKASEETTSAEIGSGENTDISDTVQYQKYKDIKLFDNEGNEFMLSDFDGKPVILNFWATWCGYCVQEMPDFEEAFKKYGDEIQFLMVNTDDGIAKGEKFIEDKGYSFPTCYDLEYRAAVTYGISGIPRTIAIDKDGNIKYNRSGMLTADMLESVIEMIK